MLNQDRINDIITYLANEGYVLFAETVHYMSDELARRSKLIESVENQLEGVNTESGTRASRIKKLIQDFHQRR